MSAARTKEYSVSTSERLEAWVGERPANPRPALPAAASPVAEAVRGWLDQLDRQPRGAVPSSGSVGKAYGHHKSKKAEGEDQLTGEDKLDFRLRLLKDLVEFLTGREIDIVTPEDLRLDDETLEGIEELRQAADRAEGRAPAGWGLSYDYEKIERVSESTTVSFSGAIRTQDGREFTIAASLTMEHEEVRMESLHIRAGDARKVDPLVLNFDGRAAELSAAKATFDLDGDGQTEQMPLLAGDRGYLALDSRGDGVVHDGRQLFGPTSGNGLSELGRYDDNGDGWIDESDPIYSELRIWQPAAEGPGTLATLADRNVGALYLGQVATPFDREANGQLLGSLTATGYFLTEDGEARPMSEVDLVV